MSDSLWRDYGILTIADKVHRMQEPHQSALLRWSCLPEMELPTRPALFVQKKRGLETFSKPEGS
ncbi:hypothetical protein IE4872_PD01455 (plasmid) [Rhizobium gallicum]|uniref:Uncharacterized protein n=1 Tax=Rhizobium gallicum TaxID=56730 RepID=A0A1L5NVN5_9HYPH|nr:hypothetical protein IE4872_PD01455 [Rhizobium gallicum]